MPRFAVIDTEGSGLFKYKDASGKPVPADAPGQPRLAAFSMILLKDDLSIEEEYHSLVQPDGWQMEPDATAVNGLTDEILRAEGRPVATVLQVYSQAVAEGFAIAAYNAQHDLKQMRAELRRSGMPDLFEQTPNVCLMRKSNGTIPKKGGKKGWPSLAECRDFLGLDGAKAHQSHTDAHDALAVLMFLHRAGVDLTPDVHYAAGGKPKGGDEPAAPVADAPISRPRAVQPALPLAEQELPE